MKRVLTAVALMTGIAVCAFAQDTSTRARTTGSSNVSAQKQGRQIDLQSGTELSAQLENALDARHAKVGDEVVLKTTQAIKENGQTVIPKGAKLIGHITDVERQTKSTGESHISMVFDRLRSGSNEIPIAATILSVTQARGQAEAGNPAVDSGAMPQSTTSTRSSSSGGGLVGGVGNSVGGVLNTATTTTANVVGNTTNAVGNTVGSTVRTAGGSLNGLQITQSSNVSADGSSTLSLSGRNLRLESGTTFNLAVSNSASAGTAP